MTPIEIRQYDVNYCGGGKNKAGYPYRAIIGLRRDDGSLIGGAYFHRDPSTMPDADTQDQNGYISCNYSWEDFPMVMDLLRNEKPVFVEFVERWNQAGITTLLEPVGEGE
jgi:hypothetical protein